MTDRPRQYIAFVIDFHRLEQALNLPRDHRLVKITLTGEHHPPGIKVIVEGPGGRLTPVQAPACYDDLDRWRKSVDEIREASIAQYGPYEW